MKDAIIALLVVLLGISILTSCDRAEQPRLPLVSADYSRCAILSPGPLRPNHKPNLYPRNHAEIS